MRTRRRRPARRRATRCSPVSIPGGSRGLAVLPGDARLIIDRGRTTLASVLKGAGYRTGVVGKWHLGLGGETLDWNGEIKPGPLEVGFDESFIMAATGDRVPCVYVKDHRVVGLDPADPIKVSYGKPIEGEPTGKAESGLLRLHPSHGHDMAIVNGISRIGYMKGGKSALWKDETMAETFTREAVAFIKRHKAEPFFLYFATHDVHVPRVPHPRFAGKSGMGPRGDAIVEFDWSVGEVLKALDETGWPRTRWWCSPATMARSSTTATVTTPSRNSATTSRPARIAAASTASSKAEPASRSWSGGLGGSSPGPQRRCSARSTSSRAWRPWSVWPTALRLPPTAATTWLRSSVTTRSAARR